MKRLIGITLAASVLLGLAYGPRRYTASASASISTPPAGAHSELPRRHPRFIQYDLEILSDEEIIQRELPHIMDGAVIAYATKLLATDGVSEAELGGDAARWFQEHVEITAGESDVITIRVSAWQSWHTGRKNHRRNTLAWKALVALLSAYQADALGDVTDAVDVTPSQSPPLFPRLFFHNVEGSLL
jgi:hypothetical protein